MKLAALEKHLRRNGCVFYREGGAHSVWHHPARGKIASVPRHREIKEAPSAPFAGSSKSRNPDH
jgi:mRNA interferase HicA